MTSKQFHTCSHCGRIHEYRPRQCQQCGRPDGLVGTVDKPSLKALIGSACPDVTQRELFNRDGK